MQQTKHYIYKDKEYPSLYHIRQLLPNYGIPSTVTDEQLADIGVTVKIIEPSLEEVKTSKKNALKYERDRRETLPIEYKGKAYDYDDKARERMSIAQQALEDNNIPSQTWTCADDSITELTIADFKAINTFAAQRSGQLHKQYSKLKIYIDTLKTVREVESITFDTKIS